MSKPDDALHNPTTRSCLKPLRRLMTSTPISLSEECGMVGMETLYTRVHRSGSLMTVIATLYGAWRISFVLRCSLDCESNDWQDQNIHKPCQSLP